MIDTLEENFSTKENKLFTMCMKKFIKKIFHHMVATKFQSWEELDIQHQDGLAYPVYNYLLDNSDVRCKNIYKNHGLEIDYSQTLLADLSVSAILEEENSIGLEFYLYETVSVTPYICPNYESIAQERPDMSHFTQINHKEFDILYRELCENNLFDDIYYEMNKSILLIELSEREALAELKKESLRILSSVFSRKKSVSNLNTITNTDIKEFRLDIPIEDKIYSLVILNGHDAENQPIYSSVLTLPEYKSVAQYVSMDELYEKILKILRGKNISTPEHFVFEAFKRHDLSLIHRNTSTFCE